MTINENAQQALQQQKLLLQMEYYAEKEAFRKQTEVVGMQRKVKRGDAWFPLRVGKTTIIASTSAWWRCTESKTWT